MVDVRHTIEPTVEPVGVRAASRARVYARGPIGLVEGQIVPSILVRRGLPRRRGRS